MNGHMVSELRGAQRPLCVSYRSGIVSNGYSGSFLANFYSSMQPKTCFVTAKHNIVETT